MQCRFNIAPTPLRLLVPVPGNVCEDLGLMYKVSYQSIIIPPLSVTTGPALAFAIRTLEKRDANTTESDGTINLTAATQLLLYSCHEWPVGQCKNFDGDIVPGLTKLARGLSVVRNHHKLVAVASYNLKIRQDNIQDLELHNQWGDDAHLFLSLAPPTSFYEGEGIICLITAINCHIDPEQIKIR